MLGNFAKSRLGRNVFGKALRFHFSEGAKPTDPNLDAKETLDDAAWLEKFKLKEYSKFRAKKLSPTDFQSYFEVLRRMSGVKVESESTQVLFEVNEGTALVALFRIWLAIMLPATILSLQLLYFMTMDAPSPDSGKESSSPEKQS